MWHLPRSGIAAATATATCKKPTGLPLRRSRGLFVAGFHAPVSFRYSDLLYQIRAISFMMARAAATLLMVFHVLSNARPNPRVSKMSRL